MDSASNSVHIGLDNEEVRLADRVGEFPVGRWGWVRSAYEWDAQFTMMDTTLAVGSALLPSYATTYSGGMTGMGTSLGTIALLGAFRLFLIYWLLSRRDEFR